MAATGDDGLHARWETWARKALGGSPEQVEAATRAVMSAIEAGAGQDEAVEHARAAWKGEAAPVVTAKPYMPRPQAEPAAGGPGIVGRVAGFQARNEMYGRSYLSVWDFRVERPGMPSVPVEMRGFSFDGAVANGDEVRISATPSRGGIVRVKSLENLTSNATVRVTRGAVSPGSVIGKTMRVVFVVIFLIIVAFIIFTAVMVFKSQGGP
jgi:hypothetical protein